MITKLKEWIKQSDACMNVFYKLRFHALGNRKIIKGSGNKIAFSNARLDHVTIKIKGNNNTIIIGESASVKECTIQMMGDNHLLDLGKNTIFVQSNFAFEDHHGLIRIGDRSSMLHHGLISAVEPYSKVEIGVDCMFSTNVDIRNTDSHSILDRKTGERINPGKNITIGNKVWLGAYVQVVKGVVIGNNTVIGIRSLVTKEIPPHSLAAGIPAKVIRTDIDWKEERI